MIRSPIESPGGKNRIAMQQDEPVLLEERPDLVDGPLVHEREQHLRPVERRDRDEVEDHQQQVDLDEEEQHIDEDVAGPVELRLVDDVAQRDRRGGRQDEVRQRPGGGDDRLAAPPVTRGSSD